MAKDTNKNDKKLAKELEFLQSQFKELMSSELKSLEGESDSRQATLSRLHNSFLQSVQQDAVTALKRKSPNQSTYDYIASALTGRPIDPKDPQDAITTRNQLDQLLSGGDVQLASYFMANGLSDMHIYDEIDSICAYMYQLNEAVDIIRDCVFASDNPAEGISIDIKFEGLSESDTAEHRQTIMDMFRNEGLTKKITSHIGPNAVKYGKYYNMIIPFSDISEKMANLRGGYGALENTVLFESASSNKTTDEYTLESVMTDIADILDYNPKDKSANSSTKIVYETICTNVKSMVVCENNEPPNVTGMSYENLSGIDKDILDAVFRGNKDKRAKAPNQQKGTKQYADGLINNTTQDEKIKGCYIKLIDPRQMRPIKIFDYKIGYYYAENYDYNTYGGTTITDMLSNTMHFDQKTQIIDRIVDSVLKKLKYGEVMKRDSQFKSLILNCLLYAEKRDNPIRIKFVPVDYVTEWNTNTDVDDNGQPVLLRSLVFSRLYISLLLFYISAVVTKSTDSEYYYLKDSALDQTYENQVAEILDQLQQCNLDPIAIAQGQMLNVNKAVNKRFFLPMGISGEKMFDIDVMSGQNINIDTEFLTDVKKQAISSTGVPSVQIDMVDEIEYATMANMSNIKNLRRCNIIQIDFNPSLTDMARKVARYTTNLPDDVIDVMYLNLRPSKIIQNNLTAQQLNDNVSVAQNMVKAIYRGDDSGDLSEFQKRVIDKATRDLTIELSSSAPWEAAREIVENAILVARAEMEEDAITKDNESQTS